MRKIQITAGITLVVALAGAGGADAIGVGSGNYNGEIKGDPFPGSSLNFDVKRTDHGRKVRDVQLGGLEFTCEEGDPGHTGGVALEERFKVDRHGEFGGRAHAVIQDFDPPARFTGRLRKHGRATGTIRVHGELDPQSRPGVNCDTGVLEWRAKRGPRNLG